MSHIDNCSNDTQVLIRDDRQSKWLLFENPYKVFFSYDLTDVIFILKQIEKLQILGYYSVGFVSYNASNAFDKLAVSKKNDDFPLIWFAIYKKFKFFLNTSNNKTVNPFALLNWQANINSHQYRLAFNQIKKNIYNGNCYQVNLTYRLNSSITNYPNLVESITNYLVDDNPKYGALIATNKFIVCSSSPELFFQKHKNKIISRPMKGTIDRDILPNLDLINKNLLSKSKKDRAENAMITDMMRNDLSKIANIGSVNVKKPFFIENHRHIWQMTSSVTAKTNASLSDIFIALFPAASITGTPKISSMNIINDLEFSPRNIYCGAIGLIAPNQFIQFNVAIRTLLINRLNYLAEYGTGGGIVYDSKLKNELDETKIKSYFLTSKPLPKFELLESILWKNEFKLLLLHLKRLKLSAQYWRYPFNNSLIVEKLNKKAKTLIKDQKYKIRLRLAKNGTTKIDAVKITNTNFLPIKLSKFPINRFNPLIYHKTTASIYNQPSLKSKFDYLYFNQDNHLTETSIANIAVLIDNKLYTPPISSGLLNGVMRQYLLNKNIIFEKKLVVSDLPFGNYIYLFNSIRGLQKVKLLP